jgi:hypothetical protein
MYRKSLLDVIALGAIIKVTFVLFEVLMSFQVILKMCLGLV